ncbi:MAG: DUF188 domain-containing protein [Alkalispirochaeta sp.]
MNQTGKDAVPVVWVDGDSCPVPIRDILVRWHGRGRLVLHFFTNRRLPLDSSVGQTVVTDGTVDGHILARLQSIADATGKDPTDDIVTDDIVVITRDIPLAERCLEYPCTVMNDRGTVFTRDTVGERRSLRDARAGIRAMGLESMDRRRTFGIKEQKLFSDALDRVLSSLAKSRAIYASSSINFNRLDN